MTTLTTLTTIATLTESFPRISKTTEMPIDNLCVGESYYVETSDSKVRGTIVYSNDFCVQVNHQLVVSGTVLPNQIYLKKDHVFDTYHVEEDVPTNGISVCFALSPFNDEIAIGLTTNIVTVWKVVSGEQVAVLGDICEHQTISCICYSPNGEYLVAGSSDGYMYIWINSTKELLRHARVVSNCVNHIKINTDNDLIIMHSSRYSANFYSISQDKFVSSLTITNQTPSQLHNNPNHPMKDLFGDIYMSAVAFSPDGTVIAMVSSININRSVVALWKHSNGKFVLLNIQDYEEHYISVCFHPSGEQLMLCSEIGTVSILDATNLTVDFLLIEPTAVHCAKYSPSGECAVTCGLDCSIRVLNTHTWELVESYTEEMQDDYEEDYDGVVSADFNKNGTKLVVCFPYRIKEIPWVTPTFIPDEFKTQLVAESISKGRDLPDTAKISICEFLYGIHEDILEEVVI